MYNKQTHNVRNVPIKPALLGANTQTKEIHTWLYPHVNYFLPKTLHIQNISWWSSNMDFSLW